MPSNALDYSTQTPRRRQPPPLAVRLIVASATGLMLVLTGGNVVWVASGEADGWGYLRTLNLILGVPTFLLAIGLLQAPRWWGDYRPTQIALQVLHIGSFLTVTLASVLAFIR